MADMTSREIIRRIVARDNPPRMGWNFNPPGPDDMVFAPARIYQAKADPCAQWGRHEELLRLTGFSGEVCRDEYGNIYGRFNGKTKGECIRGCIFDWDEDFPRYRLPEVDPAWRDALLRENYRDSEKYVMCWGSSLFSLLRDARLMANALMDTIAEPEYVTAFLDRVVEHEIRCANLMAGCGIDAVAICDDWGIQDRTFISPKAFRSLFKPAYQRVAAAYHNCGIRYFVHSCGLIEPFMEDFLQAGVDVFQFDQPDAYPCERLAAEYGGRAVFWSPVDIQKVLPTGDRERIETRALEMCRMFRASGGGWIAKDYPSLEDIGVKDEWAGWARDVITANSVL